jgi:hypothetical protein
VNITCDALGGLGDQADPERALEIPERRVERTGRGAGGEFLSRLRVVPLRLSRTDVVPRVEDDPLAEQFIRLAEGFGVIERVGVPQRSHTTR